MKRLGIGLALAGLALGAAGLAKAQSAPSTRTASGGELPLRWQESFEAFAAADRVRVPQPGGVLFIGSSSIRLWENLETAFGPDPVVLKRGFGGSRLTDCTQWADRLVIRYRPRLVVLYAGDNDIAEGATPAQVAERFDAFVAAVRAELPHTRIAYLSIKPSPLRVALMERAREANALIAARVRDGDNLDFIDIFDLMLGVDGQPRADLYGADRLHLNQAGYAIWRSAIAGHLGVGAAPSIATTSSAAR